MLKKSLQFGIVLFFIGSGAFAQWGGSTSTSGDTYRDGRVGIGTSTPGAKLEINMFNQNVVPQYGLLLKTNTFHTWPNADSSYFIRAEEPGNTNATFVLNGKGHVGIGTPSPSVSLHVYNATPPANSINSVAEFARITGSTSDNLSQFRFLLKRHTLSTGGWTNMSARLQFTTDVTDQGYIEFNPKEGSSGIAFGSEFGEVMRLLNNGNVGIGTTNPGSYKLAVEGKIAARGVKVTTAAFADYVFEPTYKLRSLSSVENYINENKHLPGMPSAKEVEKEGGFELGNMNVKLLEKIEELTLYVIELKKENEQMKKEIKEIKEKR